MGRHFMGSMVSFHDQVHTFMFQSLQPSLKIPRCHTRECEIVLPRCWRVYAALLSGFTFEMPINASPPNRRTRVLCVTRWANRVVFPFDLKTHFASVTLQSPSTLNAKPFPFNI